MKGVTIMDCAELGRRIKEARLSKKMTQIEVVGTFITRNMLSQIESGTATPSVRTLEYLSNILDIPINKLLPDSTEDELNYSDNAYIKGKAYYKSKNYSLAIDTLEEILIETYPLYDEISALLAKAYYEQARLLYSSSEYNKTQLVSYLKKSAQLSSNGLFSNRELKTSTLMLLDSLLEEQYNEEL